MQRAHNQLLAAAMFMGCVLAATPSLAHKPLRDPGVGSYSLDVQSAEGHTLPVFRHRGRTYVLGQLGQRYEVLVRNNSNRRVEAVVSIDGLDAIDGKRGDLRKRGYIVEPWQTLRIDGFRVSLRDVAAFRFSRVRSSYAARTGRPRNIGVIGVAIFPERTTCRGKCRPWWRRWVGNRGRHSNRDGSRDHAEHMRRKDTDAASGKPSAERAPKSAAKSKGYRHSRRHRRSRRGLGTEFGERRYSPVHEMTFRRANKRRPATTMTIRYNDRAGLQALGIKLNRWRRHRHDDLHKRETARPFRQSRRPFARPPRGW